MIFLSAQNPTLINLVFLGLLILAGGIILRHFKQPYIIIYILAGMLAGDQGLGLITNKETIHIIGEFGLIMLLFFIGMEISLPRLIKNWKVPIFGTLMQITGSLLLVGLLSWINGWAYNQTIVLGFIICLSSSAVVIKLLQDSHEVNTKIGQSVISILIMQDILIVPFLLITNYLGGNSPTTQEIILQTVGGIMVVGMIIWILRKDGFSIPFLKGLKNDHELQVFLALMVCLGWLAPNSILRSIRGSRGIRWRHARQFC